MIKPKTKVKEFINFKLKKTKVLLRLQLSSLNFYIFLKYDAHNELYYLHVLWQYKWQYKWQYNNNLNNKNNL